MSPIFLRARLFRNAFNEREWLLHGLWKEEGLDHVFDADLEAGSLCRTSREIVCQMTRPLSALVIGNAKYLEAGNLKNPANDADDIAAKLEARGFTVTKKIDATHKEMDRALREFKRALKGEEVGLFFFAGHGVQIEGDNYLAATDTEVSDEIDAKHSALSLNRVIETMERAGTSTNIIILDACRDNPWDRAWRRPATSRGLAPVYAPKGTLIAFATSPGQVAGDGKGPSDPVAALLKHIDTPDCSIEMMFKRVRNTLSAATSQKQISWKHTSLSGEFYFNLGVGARNSRLFGHRPE